MANYANILAEIAAAITTNDNEEITGAVLQTVLLDMVGSMGTGYQFMGIASPSTAPGTPDAKVWYIGPSGTYTNFGASADNPFVVPDGNLAVFRWTSVWSRDMLPITAAIEIVNNLTDGGVDKALSAEQGKVLKNMIELQAPRVENKILYFGEAADGYIEDGLVFHLDGIDKGQNSGEWTDLVGGVRFTNNDCVFRTNHVEFPSDSWGWLSTSTGLQFSAATHTIEIVFDGDLSGSNKFLFFGNASNSIIVAYVQASNIFLMSSTTARSTFSARPLSGPVCLSMNNLLGVENMADLVRGSDNYFGDLTGTAYIGRRSTSNAAQKFVGKIYSIRIYNRQLSRLEMLKNQQYDAIRFNL